MLGADRADRRHYVRLIDVGGSEDQLLERGQPALSRSQWDQCLQVWVSDLRRTPRPEARQLFGQHMPEELWVFGAEIEVIALEPGGSGESTRVGGEQRSEIGQQ